MTDDLSADLSGGVFQARPQQTLSSGHDGPKIPVTGLVPVYKDDLRCGELQTSLIRDRQDRLRPWQSGSWAGWVVRGAVPRRGERFWGDDLEYAALLDKCSGIVVRQVESLRNVVARFRDFSRPVEPRFALVDLNALVADVGALQRDLRVELDLAHDLGTIRADDDQLRQLLMNLARNAQTATAGCESPCLRLATRAAGESVVLEVEDNGPGIPADERERVFEPYRSGSAGGLGLGLALVKGIVLAHGGSVRVEEGRLGGACLRVELRRDPEAKHD